MSRRIRHDLRWARVRQLRQRKVLAETSCGIALGSTIKQCQQNSATGFRTDSPTRKPGWNSCSRERLLQIGRVTGWCMQQDGYLVKRDAALCLELNPPCDLYALLHFACGRAKRDGI